MPPYAENTHGWCGSRRRSRFPDPYEPVRQKPVDEASPSEVKKRKAERIAETKRRIAANKKEIADLEAELVEWEKL